MIVDNILTFTDRACALIVTTTYSWYIDNLFSDVWPAFFGNNYIFVILKNSNAHNICNFFMNTWAIVIEYVEYVFKKYAFLSSFKLGYSHFTCVFICKGVSFFKEKTGPSPFLQSVTESNVTK